MCTVTLVPLKENNFILTSNRDEAINRKTLLPEFYHIDNTRMLFPKDAVAGGTWIGVSDKNTMICLLNGGFYLHKSGGLYRQSRGVVVKDFLAANNLEQAIKNYNYQGIEPFTIVAASWQSELVFYELVWDGERKYIKELEKETHIWSSSTLYSAEMKLQREMWFNDFKDDTVLGSENLLGFHKNAGVGDPKIDLQIDRGMLKTRSITQVVKVGEEIAMRYEDLQKKSVSAVVFETITV